MKYFIHKQSGQIFTEIELAKHPAKVELVPYYPPKYLKHRDNGRTQLWTLMLHKSNKYDPYEPEEEEQKLDEELTETQEEGSIVKDKRHAPLPSFLRE